MEFLNYAGDLVIQGEIAIQRGPMWLDVLTDYELALKIQNAIANVADNREVTVNIVYAGPVTLGKMPVPADTYFVEYAAFMHKAAPEDLQPLLEKLNASTSFETQFRVAFPEDFGMRVYVSDYPTGSIVGSVTTDVPTPGVGSVEGDNKSSKLEGGTIALIVLFSICVVALLGYAGCSIKNRKYDSVEFITATKKIEVVNPTYTGE